MTEVLWTETAVGILERVGDRIQQELYEASKRLASHPEKQGKALREGLLGFRSLRAIGQRHRIISSVSADTRKVVVIPRGFGVKELVTTSTRLPKG